MLPKGARSVVDTLSLFYKIFFSLTILPQFQTSKAPYVWKGSRGEDPCLRLPKGARWMMDTLSTQLVLEDPHNQSCVLLYIYVLSYNHFTTTIDQSKKEAKVESLYKRPLLALKGTRRIMDSIPSWVKGEHRWKPPDLPCQKDQDRWWKHFLFLFYDDS